jgi:hypothetical protein
MSENVREVWFGERLISFCQSARRNFQEKNKFVRLRASQSWCGKFKPWMWQCLVRRVTFTATDIRITNLPLQTKGLYLLHYIVRATVWNYDGWYVDMHNERFCQLFIAKERTMFSNLIPYLHCIPAITFQQRLYKPTSAASFSHRISTNPHRTAATQWFLWPYCWRWNWTRVL